MGTTDQVTNDQVTSDQTGTSGRRTGSGRRWVAGAAIAATLALITSLLANASAFDDVRSDAYYSTGVEWMAANGLTTGTSPSTFDPAENVTRAEFATFVWRMAGSPAPQRANPFVDVPRGEFYTDAVVWFAEQGFTTGVAPGFFAPEAGMSRAEGATFLWRYAGKPSGTGYGFNDVPGGSFYSDAVRWMVGAGITTGTSSSTYSPDQSVTRGQAATFLYRMANGGVAGTLSWAPPSGWEGYRTVNVSTDGGKIDLPNDNIRLVMPSSPVRNTVFVDGGRNVVVIGGTVDIDNGAGSDSEMMGMRFRDQTGIIHVEGIHLTGDRLVEGIQFDAPDAHAVVQNVRIDPIKGSSKENHADLIQPWGSLESLKIDRLTGTSHFQGLMLKADSNGSLGPVTVRRVDITMVEGDHEASSYPNNGGRYALWVSDSGSQHVHYDPGTVWVDTNSWHNSGDLHANVWPHPNSERRDDLGTYVEYDQWNVSGRVYKGTPDVGDYVPAGSVGTGYRTPGYAG